VPYICGTSKDKNHYHIREKPQTTLPKKFPPNTKSKRTHTLKRLNSIELLAHPKVRPYWYGCTLQKRREKWKCETI